MRKLRLREQKHLPKVVGKGAAIVLRTILKVIIASIGSSHLAKALTFEKTLGDPQVQMPLFPQNWSQRHDQVPKHILMRKGFRVIHLHLEMQRNHQLGGNGQRLKQGVKGQVGWW